MACIPINNVQFSPQSRDAIDDIRRRMEAGRVLSILLPAGVMATIFVGNKPLIANYNITQTDFVTFTRAMSSLPAIQRKVIRDIAAMQALSRTGKESQFWQGVYDGCDIR
jgi:hypothetical protein